MNNTPLNNTPVIMMIDDSESDLYLARYYLDESKLFGDIEGITCARRALEALRDRAESGQALPDIILLDINMPSMNGFEFLDELERLDLAAPASRKPGVFVVSTSDYVLDQERAKRYQLVLDYLTKPIFEESCQKIRQQYLNYAQAA